MTIDDKIEENIEHVERKEFLLGMSQVLDNLSKQYKHYTDVLRKLDKYEKLGYDIEFYYNNNKQNYSFKPIEPIDIGFR